MALLSDTKIPTKHGSSPIMATITLARWQWLRIWRPLFFIGLGMLVAIILTCTLPLFSWLALTAGLHTALQTPDNIYVTAHSTLASTRFNTISPQLLPTGNNIVAPDVQKYLGAFASTTTIQEVHSDNINYSVAPQLPDPGRSDTLQFIGMEMNAVQSHLHMLSGRLPDPNASTLEIAIARDTATYVHVQVGAIFNARLNYRASILRESATDETQDQEVLPLHVVGIFQPANDLFWHGQTPGVNSDDQGLTHQRIIIPASTWLNALSSVTNPAETLESYTFPIQLFWYYHINPNAITSKNFAEFLDALNTFSFNTSVDMQTAGISNPTIFIPTTTLQQYNDHITVAQLPTQILTLLVIGLLVLFISLMSELLIERQASAVAILRSRGASHTQIFIAIFAQWSALALIALGLGPWLSIPITSLLVQHTLTAADQPTLALLTNNPVAALFDLRWLILGTMAVVLLTMGLATFRATRFDVLALRRESSRESQPPFWQRAYLDLVVLFCAVIGYAVSAYIVNANLLDDKVRIVLQAPLILVTSTLLLFAGALIFLRLFPHLLRLSLLLFGRGRGITSLLSLGLMSRAPRQALRMVLLLTFALAFTIFALLFSTSQQQHLLDVAAYQTGADFSGQVTHLQGQQIAPYQHIAGVHAATLGYTATLRSATGNVPTGDTPIKMLAIDPDTFNAATTWSNMPSSSRDLLLHQLGRQRSTLQQKFNAGASNAQSTLLPVIIDTQASETLHIQVGSPIHFYLTIGGNATQDGIAINPNCIVIGVVPTIPSINDNAGIGNGESGVLLDYQSYNTLVMIQGRQMQLSQPVNYLWLNTTADAHSLANIRATINHGPLALSQLNDRRAILTILKEDPLYLNFVGVLLLGAIAPILLALVGNLLSSWWSARSRVSSFVVLRALGSSPTQLNQILFCEQLLIYLTALILGLLFGFLLAALTLPSLVFTSITQSGIINEGNIVDTFSLQHIPPVQLIVPATLFFVLTGLLLICIIALAIMVRTVTRPTVAQTLRVNED